MPEMIDAKLLLQKYREGKCSEEEIKLLHNWFHNLNIEDPTELNESDFNQYNESSLVLKHKTISKRLTWLKIAASVAAVLVLCFYILKIDKNSDTPETKTNKISSNAVILQLEDGRKIDLNNVDSGQLDFIDGVTIDKSSTGRIQYKFTHIDTETPKKIDYHTVHTPNGEIFEIVLADGTTVTLNTLSSIRFPTSFEHLTTREVELNGEAYFNVTKSKSPNGKHQPFLVKSKNQQVEVLGTAFNVQAYEDENAVKTTLEHGKVRVFTDKNSNGVFLNNIGEQAIIQNNDMTKVKVSLDNEIAWKSGKYVFHEQDIYSIMRTLARNHTIQIQYKDDFKGELFGAIISKNKSLEQILKLLEDTGEVKFKISSDRGNLQERRIVVMK